MDCSVLVTLPGHTQLPQRSLECMSGSVVSGRFSGADDDACTARLTVKGNGAFSAQEGEERSRERNL